MERRNTRQTREIVVPGDILDGTGMKPGDFAYFDKGKVRASVMPAFAEGLELKSAALQNDAGLVGAVYYFKNHHE